MRLYKIELELRDEAYSILDKISNTGLFGKSPAEAAERLLCRAIESYLYDNDCVTLRQFPKPPDCSPGDSVNTGRDPQHSTEPASPETK